MSPKVTLHSLSSMKKTERPPNNLKKVIKSKSGDNPSWFTITNSDDISKEEHLKFLKEKLSSFERKRKWSNFTLAGALSLVLGGSGFLTIKGLKDAKKILSQNPQYKVLANNHKKFTTITGILVSTLATGIILLGHYVSNKDDTKTINNLKEQITQTEAQQEKMDKLS